MADYRPLEAELIRFLELRGVPVTEARGDRYIAIGPVTRASGKEYFDGEAQPKIVIGDEDRCTTQIFCIADLADHITNVWDGR